MQINTCPVDNNLAILNSKKANILEALDQIGTSLIDTKFHHLFKLAACSKFDELRDHLAKQLGLEVQYDSTGLMRSYDFLDQKAQSFNS